MPSAAAKSVARRGSAVEELAPRPLSDTEFEAEVQRLSVALEDKDNWEKRVGALKELRRIVLADISNKRNFAQLLTGTLRQTLKAQIEDLRSAVSREACAVVRAICLNSENKGNWELISDWFLPSLFSNSCATVAVIAQSADDTLQCIAACGYISRNAMLCFLKNCGSKHNVVRRNAFQCLLLILQNCDPGHNQRHTTQLCEVVRAGVYDAVQETRKIARMCFWALENICVNEAVDLFAGCEPQVQRAIEQEKASYFEWLQAGELPSASTKGGGAGGVGAKISGGGGGGGGAAVAATNSARSQRSDTSGLGASGGSRRAEEPPVAAGVAAKRGAGVSGAAAKPAGLGSRSAAGDALASSTAAGAAPSSTAAAPARFRDPAASSTTSSPSAPPRPRPKAKTAAASSARATGATGLQQQQQQQPVSHNRSADLASADPAGSEDGWMHIQATVSSSDWATRVNAFNGIAELADFDALTPARALETIDLVIKFSSDTHYRVVCAALLCLEKLLERMPEHLAPNLERVLACLITKEADAKESVRNLAHRLLVRIIVPFGHEALLPATLKVFDLVAPKQRAQAIEYAVELAQGASSYFTSTSNVKAFLNKVLVIAVRLSPGDARVARAAGLMLAQIYARNADVFVLLLAGMPVADREEVVRLVKPHVPHIAQDLRRAMAGERLLPHPEVVVSSPFAKGSQAAAAAAAPTGSRGTPTSPAAAAPGGASGSVAGGSTNKSSGGKSFGAARGAGRGHSLTPATLLYDHDEEGNEHVVSRLQQSQHAGAAGPVQSQAGYNPRAFDPAAPRNADALRARPGVQPAPQTTFSALLGHKKSLPDEISALRNAATSQEKWEAVLNAGDSLTKNPRLWEDHYATILPYALAFANDTDHAIRKLALQWLVAIEEARPLLTRPNDASLDHFLRCAAVCLDDPFPEVQAEGATLLRTALSHAPMVAAVGCMLEVTKELSANVAASTRSFQQMLRTLGELCVRDGNAAVGEWAPQLLSDVVEFLTRCFLDEHSDIRKTVVLNFVDLYSLLGADLLPHIKHLSVSQLKLISIYHNRSLGDSGIMAQGSGARQPTDLLREMQALGII